MRRLRNTLHFAAVALAIGGAWTGAFGQQPNIVGTWEWTRKKNGCVEQLVFRHNGTVSIRRGEERTENDYRMSWAPEATGRYRLTITTVSDDGGRDCDDSTENSSGRMTIVYVLFSQTHESMIHCGSPGGADCTGLMRRSAR